MGDYNEDFTFLKSIRYGYSRTFVFSIPFGSIYTMQGLLCLGRIVLVSIWFKIVLTQIINLIVNSYQFGVHS